MRFSHLIIVSCLCAVLGLLTFCYRRGWIIIAYPSPSQQTHISRTPIQKKKVTLSLWQRNAWHSETVTILWSSDTATNLYQLINRWLTFLDDEQLLSAPVILQAATLSPSNATAYLSFDHTFLPKDASTHTKWHLVESLLKTIRDSGIAIQELHLLVHHQPLIDDHLDFSHPWPIGGFM